MDTIPQSRPGYTTITDNGKLINVPTNQSSKLPSGKVYVPKVGGGGGGSPTPPQDTGLITQSTKTNQPQVKAQFEQLQKDTAAQKDFERQAQQKIRDAIQRISNFDQLNTAIQNKIINQEYERANKYYQNMLSRYYNDPGTRVPVPIELKEGQSKAIKLNTSINPYVNPIVPKEIANVYKNIYQGIYNFLDNYSGGKLTSRQLDDIQNKLNKRVEDYKLNYENKSLSNQDYKKANAEFQYINQAQRAIDITRNNGPEKINQMFKEAKTSSKGNIYNTIFKIVQGSNYRSTALGSATALANAGVALVTAPKDLKDLGELILQNKKLETPIGTAIANQLIETGTRDVELFKINPQVGLARVATQLGIQWALFKVTDRGLEFVSKLKNKAALKLEEVLGKSELSPLGVRTLKKLKEINRLELISPEGTLPKVNPEKAVREANLVNQLKERPSLALPNSEAEKEILKIVKSQGDAVSGSYAQESLLKKGLSRRHKDLDVLTGNREVLIRKIQERFGNSVKFKPLKNSIEVIYKGKPIADLVEFSKGEAGFVKKYGIVKVNGIYLVRPEARLASKVYQLGIGKAKFEPKVLKDIENLYGNKVSFKKPSLKGAFGYSPQELSKYVGKTSTLTSSQADFLKKSILNKFPELELKRWFYATPSDIKTGIAQARISRLGISKGEEASLMDLLTGKASFKKGKPEIFVLPDEKIFAAPKQLSKSKFIRTKGFVVPKFSSELEVVLGDGYILKRGRKLGSRIVEGNRVDVVKLEKIKIPRSIEKDLSQLKELNKVALKKKGLSVTNDKEILVKIAKKELNLNRKLKSLTGLDYFSYNKVGKNYYPVGKKLGAAASSGIVRPKTMSRGGKTYDIFYNSQGKPYIFGSRGPQFIKIPKRVYKALSVYKSVTSTGKPSSPKYKNLRVSRPISPSKVVSPSKSIPRSPPKSPQRYLRPPVRSPPKYPPKYPPRKLPPKSTKIIRSSSKNKKKKEKKKVTGGYFVYARPLKKQKGQKKPKLIKINRTPLTESRAKDLRNYITDTSLARTATLKRTKLKAKSPEYLVPRGYAQLTNKKFRTYRIKKGKKISLPRGKVIELSKNLLDTIPEKKKIDLLRRLKQIPKVKKTKAKVNKNSKAYEIKLKNLEKARKVLKTKRRKNKK